jgi:hypothetical protein
MPVRSAYWVLLAQVATGPRSCFGSGDGKGLPPALVLISTKTSPGAMKSTRGVAKDHQAIVFRGGRC